MNGFTEGLAVGFTFGWMFFGCALWGVKSLSERMRQ